MLFTRDFGLFSLIRSTADFATSRKKKVTFIIQHVQTVLFNFVIKLRFNIF